MGGDNDITVMLVCVLPGYLLCDEVLRSYVAMLQQELNEKKKRKTKILQSIQQINAIN